LNYIKKSELKKILTERLIGLFDERQFKLLRSKSRFLKYVDGGLIMIDYRVVDAYNFDRNEVAWKIELTYFIGFESVHKWFEIYEDRDKKDYKYYWTYGRSLDTLSNGVFQVDVDDSNINEFLNDFIEKVNNGFSLFYSRYNHLDELNKAIIPYPIKSIDDIKKFNAFNARVAIESLAIAWILQRDDFDTMLDVFSLKLKDFAKIGDPTSELLYPKLDNIIKDLKQTDFSKYPNHLEINTEECIS